MNDTNNDAPENNAVEAPQKPTPPLPPPPGEMPPAPAPAERAPLPDYDPGPSPPKSPPAAAILSILLPGLGHLYLWAYERAFMIWATIGVCILLIIQGFWPFSFLIAFVYFFSIFDSYREAQFFNLRVENEEPKMPKADNHGRLMFGVFLAVVAAVVLADKLDLFDMDWIYDWWPVPVFLVGVYFIVAAIVDKMKARNKAGSFGEGEDY
jgi:hypothetical protein